MAHKLIIVLRYAAVRDSVVKGTVGPQTVMITDVVSGILTDSDLRYATVGDGVIKRVVVLETEAITDVDSGSQAVRLTKVRSDRG